MQIFSLLLQNRERKSASHVRNRVVSKYEAFWFFQAVGFKWTWAEAAKARVSLHVSFSISIVETIFFPHWINDNFLCAIYANITWRLLFISDMKLLMEILGSFRSTCFIIHIVLIIKPAVFSLLSDFSFTFLTQEIHLPGCWEETWTFIKPLWPILPRTGEGCCITNPLCSFSLPHLQISLICCHLCNSRGVLKITKWRRFYPKNHYLVWSHWRKICEVTEKTEGSNIGICYRNMIICCQSTIENPSFLLIFFFLLSTEIHLENKIQFT